MFYEQAVRTRHRSLQHLLTTMLSNDCATVFQKSPHERWCLPAEGSLELLSPGEIQTNIQPMVTQVPRYKLLLLLPVTSVKTEGVAE